MNVSQKRRSREAAEIDQGIGGTKILKIKLWKGKAADKEENR